MKQKSYCQKGVSSAVSLNQIHEKDTIYCGEVVANGLADNDVHCSLYTTKVVPTSRGQFEAVMALEVQKSPANAARAEQPAFAPRVRRGKEAKPIVPMSRCRFQWAQGRLAVPRQAKTSPATPAIKVLNRAMPSHCKAKVLPDLHTIPFNRLVEIIEKLGLSTICKAAWG